MLIRGFSHTLTTRLSILASQHTFIPSRVIFARMATIAAFKVPNVTNEPNVDRPLLTDNEILMQT